MAKNIARISCNLLDLNHPLYQKLLVEQPSWWKNVTTDNEFYIEIRKGNIIDVYYEGGRAAQICLMKERFVVTAHPKYVYDNVKKDDSRLYRQSKKDGKIIFSAIYQDCLDCLATNEKIARMKQRIRDNYSSVKKEDSESNIEDISEKFIQGKLVVNNRGIYLDSEFAHKLFDEPRSRKTVRFDLVKIENGRLIFVELKRFWDSRMRTTKGEPEIIEQMTNYKDFIEVNRNELCEYYKILYQIKMKLNLPVPSIKDINKLEIEVTPQLLIALYHDNVRHGPNAKEKRQDYINSHLKTKGICPQYFE